MRSHYPGGRHSGVFSLTITSIAPLLRCSRAMLISRFLCLMAAPLVARAADTSSHRVTSVFIDTVSGYDELSTCAEEVLSTIVRAQYSGCGDKGAVTSYTCFCTDSSSEMSSMITNAVSLSCDSSVVSAQASSAIDVFDAYCAIGVPDDLVETTTTGGTYHLIGARAAECKRSCTDPRNDSFHSKRNRNCNASGHGVDNCGIGDFSDFGHRFFFFNFNVHAQHVNEPLEGRGHCSWCLSALWRHRHRSDSWPPLVPPPPPTFAAEIREATAVGVDVSGDGYGQFEARVQMADPDRRHAGAADAVSQPRDAGPGIYHLTHQLGLSYIAITSHAGLSTTTVCLSGSVREAPTSTS